VPLETAFGVRTISMPDELVTAFKQHRDRQQVERRLGGKGWNDGDFLFCDRAGVPLRPEYDSREWQRVLQRAGVPDVPLRRRLSTFLRQIP
jgi:hypothetical protein